MQPRGYHYRLHSPPQLELEGKEGPCKWKRFIGLLAKAVKMGVGPEFQDHYVNQYLKDDQDSLCLGPPCCLIPYPGACF